MPEVYVGNLRYSVTLEEVRDLFAQYGTVHNVRLIAERVPGRPHAYAFVDMDDDAAGVAIQMLDGTDFLGRTLRVEPSRVALERRMG